MVFNSPLPGLWQLGLFQNTVQSALCKIIVWVTGNGDSPWFMRVLVLPVTATRYNQVPTIRLNELDNITHLHNQILTDR